MFNFKTNVSCVLESVFAGFKDENIQLAADKIAELHANELERIKSEISQWCWDLTGYGDIITRHNVESIIDDHMDELKGED